MSNETHRPARIVGTKGRWKIAVLALGVLLVVGATAYSLTIRHAAVAGAPSNNGSAALMAATASGNAQGIGDLAWVKGLGDRFADQDFVFVIMPGGEDAGGKVVQEVAKASAKIEAQGVSVGNLTLGSSDPEFSITTERLAIQKLPAVLVLSSSGSGAIVTGEITETKLLQAYVVSSTTCAPGSSSGCCP